MAVTYVVVKAAGIIVVDGADQSVRPGDIFEADHPAVRSHPELFGPIEPRFLVAREKSSKVEKATAAPGEKR